MLPKVLCCSTGVCVVVVVVVICWCCWCCLWGFGFVVVGGVVFVCCTTCVRVGHVHPSHSINFFFFVYIFFLGLDSFAI